MAWVIIWVVGWQLGCGAGTNMMALVAQLVVWQFGKQGMTERKGGIETCLLTRLHLGFIKHYL
jgi:hypothetical protein